MVYSCCGGSSGGIEIVVMMVNVFMVEVILDVCAMVVEVARESQSRGFCGGGSVVVVVVWWWW